MNFKLVVPKSIEELLQTIKATIPYRYDISNKLGTKYTHKFKKGKLIIQGNGVGYGPINLQIDLIEHNIKETEINGVFSRNLFSRFFIWTISLFLFLVSFLLLIGVAFGLPIENSPVFTISLTLFLCLASIGYLFYSERARTGLIKAMIKIVSELFTKENNNISC